MGGSEVMALPTRRDLAKGLVGIAAVRSLCGDRPMLTVSGVDHLKMRVANSGASAIFYYDVFGGEIVSVRNSTLPGSPLTNEFFLKIGVPRFPYLMLAQIRDGETPGLDHFSVLIGDPAAVHPAMVRNGVSLIHPDQGLWFRDVDGTLIEVMASPTWGGAAESIRLALPANLQKLRPAFEPLAVTRLCLRSLDVARSVHFYGQIFTQQNAKPMATGAQAFSCGGTILELKPIGGAQTTGLDRVVIAVRQFRVKEARHILQQRGIQPYGSKHEVLFRDPDGNELELVAGDETRN
jgi:catechol 2,3-dioxygenase-like lactoylglutathione lyase family enzyme